MKKQNKRGLALLFILFITFTLNANPIQPWDHEFNPALLSTGQRQIIEVGMSTKLSLSNSYFTVQQIFPADGVLLLDFNRILSDLDGNDLKVAANISFEEHIVLTIAGLSLGEYGSMSGSVSSAIPNSIIEVIADGISLGETSEDSADIYGKVFAKAGVYAGYRWRDWQFSTKVGAFAPVVYTDKNASFAYSVDNNADGNISAEASATIPFYSMLNITDMSNTDSAALINGLGYNMDLGAVKMKNGKPHYGFSLNGLTLAPATLPYTTTFSATATMTAQDLISYEEGNDPWTTDSDMEDMETVEEAYQVNLPLSLGGFYCLSGYPGFIDWIGHGEITLDDGALLLGAGVTAKGAVFPLSALSLSLGYDKFLWETSLGLRFSLHLVEVGLDVGMSNMRFVKLFTPSGLNVGLNIALGI